MRSALHALTAAMLASCALGGPGKAVIFNGCSFDVNGLSTQQTNGPSAQSKFSVKSGNAYVQQIVEGVSGGGITLQLSKTDDFNKPRLILLEYTYKPGGDGLSFDASLVDGHEWTTNWQLSGYPSCSPHQKSYWDDSDNIATQHCPIDSTLALTICPGGNDFNSTIQGLLSGLLSNNAPYPGEEIHNPLPGYKGAGEGISLSKNGGDYITPSPLPTGQQGGGVSAASVSTKASTTAAPVNHEADVKPATTSSTPSSTPSTTPPPPTTPPTTLATSVAPPASKAPDGNAPANKEPVNVVVKTEYATVYETAAPKLARHEHLEQHLH